MHEQRKFLDDFDTWNNYARELNFKGEVNPVDGVEYPDISADVPPELVAEVEEKAGKLWGRKLKAETIFFRVSSKETGTAPHQSHTDSTMGKYTFLLYFQDPPKGVEAGTSLVKHRTVGGLDTDPWTKGELDIWERDTNRYDQWTITKFFGMERNKAVTYHSKRMHRAEPVGGFGNSVDDGRLVLVAFLNG